MTSVWIFKSDALQMLALARDYQHAKEQFKNMLGDYLLKSSLPLLDELIEISRLTSDGTIDDMDSYIEFTDEWLKELGIPMDIICF